MTKFKENLELYLETLCEEYKAQQNILLSKIIVNADVDYLDVNTDVNGITRYGLVFYLPKNIFLEVHQNYPSYSEEILMDLEDITLESNELVSSIKLAMKKEIDNDWREKSGLLINQSPIIPSLRIKRIWGDSPLHVFFSYRDEDKDKVKDVKTKLEELGIVCFMADENIKTSEIWSSYIKDALNSMDVIVAFLTENYHVSDWTDQEIGFAISRGIPIISIKLGTEPYGFLKDYQLLDADWSYVADKLFEIFLDMKPDNKDYYEINKIIYSLRHSGSYNTTRETIQKLFRCNSLSEEQARNVIEAYNQNTQVSEEIYSIGYNSEKLINFLERVTNRKYGINNLGRLAVKE